MSLKIYTNKQDLRSNLKLINYNDEFFKGESLKDNALTRKIMKEIDHAEYSSENTFLGRDESLGRLNKEHLSTGCKTLLNIASNPDKCFDVIECGINVLSLLPLIKEGNILWEVPVLHYVGNIECDIIIHNKHFSDFKQFLSYVMD